MITAQAPVAQAPVSQAPVAQAPVAPSPVAEAMVLLKALAQDLGTEAPFPRDPRDHLRTTTYCNFIAWEKINQTHYDHLRRQKRVRDEEKVRAHQKAKKTKF
jgi:hypothetical protein